MENVNIGYAHNISQMMKKGRIGQKRQEGTITARRQ